MLPFYLFRGSNNTHAAQSSRTERLAIADDVIHNDGDLDATREQVRELHEIYLSLA